MLISPNPRIGRRNTSGSAPGFAAVGGTAGDVESAGAFVELAGGRANDRARIRGPGEPEAWIELHAWRVEEAAATVDVMAVLLNDDAVDLTRCRRGDDAAAVSAARDHLTDVGDRPDFTRQRVHGAPARRRRDRPEQDR